MHTLSHAQLPARFSYRRGGYFQLFITVTSNSTSTIHPSVILPSAFSTTALVQLRNILSLVPHLIPPSHSIPSPRSPARSFPSISLHHSFGSSGPLLALSYPATRCRVLHLSVAVLHDLIIYNGLPSSAGGPAGRDKRGFKLAVPRR